MPIQIVESRNKYKNFNFVVEVLVRLKEYKLAIIGGGSLSQADKGLIKYNIGNNYEHLVVLDNIELNKQYNKVFCLFYPTSYEGLGFQY